MSQDTIYTLHPVVGDTIDINDKLEYALFPEIRNFDFKFCIIKYTCNKYFLKSFTLTDSVIIKQIDTAEIRQSIENINKLVDINSNELKEDSLNNSKKIFINYKYLNTNTTSSNLIDNDSKTKILNELRTSNRLKDDAERYKNYKQGTDVFGNGLYIEFLKK